jgi:Kdo2-lipid IVA lauroyltransferase/acyltransferase
MPVAAASRIGAALGPVIGRREAPEAEGRAMAAIRQFRPDLAADARLLAAAMDRLWANYGRLFAEFCVINKMIPQGRVVTEGVETLEAVLADGRPVIVAHLHTGNWSTIGLQIAQQAPGRLQALTLGYPKNRVWTQIGLRELARYQVSTLTMHSTVWWQVLQHLQPPRRGIMMIAIDEYGPGGFRAPFLGRAYDPAGNLGKIVRLAKRTGAIILPLYSERRSDAIVCNHVMTPVELTPSARRSDTMDPEELRHQVCSINALYEPVARRLVDQWFRLFYYSPAKSDTSA